MKKSQPFEQPTMSCPRCGVVYDDFDGVGVVYCAPPYGCGFCRHIARSGPLTDGTMRCDFCGEVTRDEPELPRSPIQVFLCGGPRRRRPAPKVPRGREVQLTIDTMPKPKRPPGDRR